MRNQSTGGAKKAGPSSVDKAGGKQSMPKPRGSEKQAPRGSANPGGNAGAKKTEVRGTSPKPPVSKKQAAVPTAAVKKPTPRSEVKKDVSKKMEAGSRPKSSTEKKPTPRPTPPNSPSKSPRSPGMPTRGYTPAGIASGRQPGKGMYKK